MGAEFCTTILRVSRSDLNRAFNSLVAESRHEHGAGGYTGSFAEAPGLSIVDREPFTTQDEAYSYLDGKCEKWENAIAVPLIAVDNKVVASELEKSAKYKKLVEAVKAASDDVTKQHKLWGALAAAEFTKFKDAREYVSCPDCKSKFARRYLESFHCPLCTGRDVGRMGDKARHMVAKLTPEGARKKIVKAIEKEEKAQAELERLTKERNELASSLREKALKSLKEKPIVWMVGGVFSC